MSTLTPERWGEDLRYLVGTLLIAHRDLFHRINREDFREQVRTLERNLPSLAAHQIVVELSRLTALVGDGHTNLPLNRVSGFHRYPLRLYRYTDGLCAQAIDAAHAEVAGANLLAVDGRPADAVYDRVRPLVSRDNEMGVMAAAPELMTIPEVLHACGLVEALDRAEFTFQLPSGHRKVCELPAVVEMPADLVDVREGASAPAPLWLQQSTAPNWFTYLTDTGMLYVQLTEVRDMPDETLARFYDRVFALVEREPAQRMVLDIRRNGGGNLSLNQALIHHLIRCDRVNQWGKLFTVIGRGTFSAAMNLAVDLERHTRTLFVGEPTGSSPNHYGENEHFSLPNSGLCGSVSALWWQYSEPADTRPWIRPELPAELSSSDYAENRDSALDAIGSYKLRPEHAVEYPERLFRALTS